MSASGWLCWCIVSLVAAGCAGAPERSEEPEQRPVAPVPFGGDSDLSLEEAARRAARRLEELKWRQAMAREEDAPVAAEIRERYEEILERPGTQQERKPEILLRLAEMAYRDEEAALRGVYESGEEPPGPPGSRYAVSVARYRELAEQYPDSPQALTAFYNLGYLYAEQGDRAQSLWAYGEALSRDADSPYAEEIHMRLGEALFDAEDVEGAIPHYRAVVESGKPEYVDKALFKLGWCYYNLEEYAPAVEAFAQVMMRGDASPEDLRRETLEVMAKSFREWGGLGALEAYLAEHSKTTPYGDQLYLLLGDLYLEASRYREAVQIYTAGVEARPLSAKALAMERGILQALLVLQNLAEANARRESWVTRYGPNSEWDRVHGLSPLANERDELVEEGLRLAALYHHGRAQRGEGSLEHALELYGRYLELFGSDSEEGYELAYAHAQALREAGRLRDAAAHYRVVAWHDDWTSHREDASYRRIEILTDLYEADPAALEDLVQAHEEYVELNPDSPLVPEILFAEGELLFESERFAEAREVFGRLVADESDGRLGAEALERIARCHFREEEYALAESTSRRALIRGLPPPAGERVRKLVAFSIFKQAEQKETAKDRKEANRHFFRLADEFPEEEAAQIALHRAAENLRALGQEGEAARVYKRLARRYRGSQYAQSALVLSAQIFASLGDWREAARDYEELYRVSPDDPDAADALFQAARATERAEEWLQAARLFGEFGQRFPEDSRVAEAFYREAGARRILGHPEEAAERYRKAWESETTDDGSAYRALAALALGKMSLAAFEQVELTGNLEQALARKEEFLTEALEHLVRASSLPYAETLTESLFRAGEAFEHMRDALLNSERPEDLTDEEREEYDFLLEEKAFPLEERALSYYRRGIEAARKADVYTVWVDRMFERLEQLLPWAYQRTEEPAVAWDPPGLPAPEAAEASL